MTDLYNPYGLSDSWFKVFQGLQNNLARILGTTSLDLNPGSVARTIKYITAGELPSDKTYHLTIKLAVEKKRDELVKILDTFILESENTLALVGTSMEIEGFKMNLEEARARVLSTHSGPEITEQNLILEQ